MSLWSQQSPQHVTAKMSQVSSSICWHCAEETNPDPAGQGSTSSFSPSFIHLPHCMPRCLVGDTWPGQPVTGETDRPRKSRSMDGRRGFRRLTGQKAEPPWGVKLTLLGSGQDGCSKASSWQQDLSGKVEGEVWNSFYGWLEFTALQEVVLVCNIVIR